MKTFLVTLLMAIAAGALAHPKLNAPGMVEPRGLIEDTINNTIETEIRPNIPEPITLESAEITFPEGGLIEGKLSLKNATVSGIKDFQLTELSVNIFTLETDLTLNIPELHVQTNYVADLKVPNVDTVELKGEGPADVLLKNLKIVGKCKVNLVSTYLSLSNLVVVVSVEEATVDVTGLTGGDEADQILNDWANNKLVSFLDDNQEEISGILSPIAQTVINGILNPPGK